MSALPSGLPEIVGDHEPVARFVGQSNKFNSLGAKPAAFLPPSNGQTSVGRHGATPLDSLMALAVSFLGEAKVYGAAVVGTRQVRDTGLAVTPEEPPDRHANLHGWPVNVDRDMERAERLVIAQQLVRESNWVSFDL